MKFTFTTLTLVLFYSWQTIGQNMKRNYNNLQSKIDSIIEGSNFNGVILVTKDTATIYSKAIGYSDLENKTPIKMYEQFVIGSISKQITAVLLLREYERGKIGLDDKINLYLTEIKQPWSKEVTIHQLLTHTHGILDMKKALEFEPGSQFHYSQLGYELLAQILEKVTGKTFEELSTELFKQYGLQNSFHPDNKTYTNLVKGYEESENGLIYFTTNSLENFAAAGTFISNAQDLNKWNQLLHSGKLVQKETLELMKTRYATRIHPVFDTVEYGYGLLFKYGEENIQAGALGYVPGFVTACYYYPQTDISLIVLENTAMDLGNLKKTFWVHTEIMKIMKNETSSINEKSGISIGQ